MLLRHHPLMSYHAVPSWPPAWIWLDGVRRTPDVAVTSNLLRASATDPELAPAPNPVHTQGRGQLRLVRAVRVHHADLEDVVGGIPAHEGNLRTVRRPGGTPLVYAVCQ
jgi:hypothetical protein